MIDVDAYLARIAYDGPLAVDVPTLRALHRAHILAVPFENLDIALGRPIRLNETILFDKIVRQRRGGFCYEQNGLFAAVLRAIGFDVTLLEARVRRDDGTFGIPFDHLTLVVTLEHRWLADVGFGDSFLEPLHLDESGEQRQGHEVFRVRHDGESGIVARREADGWRDQYRFSLTPRQLADFAGGCHYHQTSPESSFTQQRVCSRATPTGRITLRAGADPAWSDAVLIVTQDGRREERPLAGAEACRAALREHFGIVLEGDGP